MYGSWFDREREWEEAAKKNPDNLLVIYYEDLKQVHPSINPSPAHPNRSTNPSSATSTPILSPNPIPSTASPRHNVGYSY